MKSFIWVYTYEITEGNTKTFILVSFHLQEVEKKARKQFKGLFDKKPGEIAEVKADEDGDQITGESKKDDEVHGDSDETNSVDSREAPPKAPRTGWFSLFWPSGRSFFESLGLNRCTIL